VALTENALPDLAAFAERLSELHVDRERVAAVTRALAPYAASLGKGGALATAVDGGLGNSGAATGKPSFWKRLLG